MTKVATVVLISLMSFVVLTGCKQKSAGKIVVGASPAPHAEILGVAGKALKEKGYQLEIKEFTDYVQPNLALQNKELDANYFQHKPYLDDFNKNNKTSLASAAAIHYEPLGIYPGKTKALADMKDGAVIAVPNDTTNEARALLLLETLKLIKLKPDAGLKATAADIVENPKHIQIKELEAAQLTRSLPDVDFAVINGNYALLANLSVAANALAKEEKESLAASTFANIIAVRTGDENRPEIKALIEALKSDAVKKFIEDKYKGSVIPVF
ncbi:methionine ABC transporter substrate-binding protein [Geobacter sp. SVR]|nr:MetQ/NlpA family ABC transporter substrate-binding protein [Geobacter sp. SVR]BCS55444.1 methionine ABC transporter substrate-binding protein [Geobacter sp. SVR]GCF83447.1 methionine ABC transporter substrate-binding protein [Geobacter sp. SVR]